MSERDVTMLLQRVAAHTPSLDVAVPEVVAQGRRRVRRRRLAGGSMTIAALAGALWWGAGPGAELLGTSAIAPASVSWEVEEETTVTVLDGVTRGGEVAPLTVTKGPDGTSATFVVKGREETVTGRTMEGGADLFVGEQATVIVWQTPPRGPGSVVLPAPEPGAASGSVKADGEQLTYWYTVGTPGYVPEDIVFYRGDQVWSASGQVVDTVELRDGDVVLTGFEVPGVGTFGVVDDESLYPVDTSMGVGGSYTVARLPREAAFARLVQADETPGGRVEEGRVVQTQELTSADLAVLDWSEFDEDGFSAVQWSADALTWHDQNVEDPTAAGVEVGPVEDGGWVVLLGERYRVQTGDRGWPELWSADGTLFLSVTDEDGVVSDGGGVTWRDGWAPWAPHHAIHFVVGEGSLPADVGDGAGLQDVVTISGPAGVVTLGAVPARG